MSRLVFVSGLPVSLPAIPPTPAEALTNPHLVDLADGTFVLDNDWWLDEEAGTTFSAEVRDWLRAHPRRGMSWSAWAPLTEAAWNTAPSTFVVGAADPLLDEEERALLEDGATRERHDIRTLDTDHFVLWRNAEEVSEVVVEALAPRR